MIDSAQVLRSAMPDGVRAGRHGQFVLRAGVGAGAPASPPPSGAAAMFPPLRRHVRPMRPERAGKLWLARLHELMAAAGSSEEDADRTGEAAADAGPVPAPEEQAAGAP